mgnify:CR=1 FL=1
MSRLSFPTYVLSPSFQLLRYNTELVLRQWKHEADGDRITAVGSELPLAPSIAVKVRTEEF